MLQPTLLRIHPDKQSDSHGGQHLPYLQLRWFPIWYQYFGLEGKIQEPFTCRAYIIIFMNGAKESMPTCFLFFLKEPSGLSQGYNCGSGLFVDSAHSHSCPHTRTPFMPANTHTDNLPFEQIKNIPLVFMFLLLENLIISARKIWKFVSSGKQNSCPLALPCAIMLSFHHLHNQHHLVTWVFQIVSFKRKIV